MENATDSESIAINANFSGTQDHQPIVWIEASAYRFVRLLSCLPMTV